MTDISITAANVVKGDGAVVSSGIAGETIAAGKAVYYATSTKKWMLADSNAAGAEVRGARGISLNGASNNQPIDVQTGGDITIGGTMTAGVAYYLSDTPGGICPVADIGAGEYVCLIGLAKTTTILAIMPFYTGVSL